MRNVQIQVTEEEYEFLVEQCEHFFPDRKGSMNLDGTPRKVSPSAKYMCFRIVRRWIKRRKGQLAKEQS